jgi:hypothetical protein
MTQVKTTSTVFVLHHTNQGTPESGEIYSIYTTKSSALAAMAEELENGYGGITMQENEDDDYIYMYITEQFLKN